MGASRQVSRKIRSNFVSKLISNYFCTTDFCKGNPLPAVQIKFTIETIYYIALTSDAGRARLIRSHSSARFALNKVEIQTKQRPVIQILAKTFKLEITLNYFFKSELCSIQSLNYSETYFKLDSEEATCHHYHLISCVYIKGHMSIQYK